MLAALRFAGYDVKHAWGEGGHDSKHSTAILPAALRWLWRDYPKPVKAGHPAKRLTDILIPGQGWELVSEGHRFTEGPAVDAAGRVFFSDIPNGRIHKVAADGTVSVFREDSPGVNGLMFGPDEMLYACENGNEEIVRFDSSGNRETICTDAPSNDCVVLPEGGYYTDPKNRKVWHIDSLGERRVVDEGIEFPNGVVTSPDQSRLYVSDTRGRFVYSFRIQPDGSLVHKQRFGYLHVPDGERESGECE